MSAKRVALQAIVIVAGSACARMPQNSRPEATPIPGASPTLAAIRIAPSKLPNACCTDATCDRIAFAKHGGVCTGDPRIKGPLPPQAVGGWSK